MVAIRSSREIAEKWSTVTPTRSAFYESGVRSPKKDWARTTLAAEQVYKDAVTKAAQEGRFGKGVQKAGTEKWQRKAIEVGAGRWGPGVAIAAPDFEAGFSPFRDAIEKVVLKPRYPKGDPRNYERVKQIGDALHALKIAR
ncbi:hypothetical protein LCGC14_0807830 [marine sediment metagenome]|uniref:Uncharacterized protein n=1 Tax=marine sediment metagenome TaxID=412755 RepID=A0A0F9PS69_9ZZZZ